MKTFLFRVGLVSLLSLSLISGGRAGETTKPGGSDDRSGRTVPFNDTHSSVGRSRVQFSAMVGYLYFQGEYFDLVDDAASISAAISFLSESPLSVRVQSSYCGTKVTATKSSVTAYQLSVDLQMNSNNTIARPESPWLFGYLGFGFGSASPQVVLIKKTRMRFLLDAGGGMCIPVGKSIAFELGLNAPTLFLQKGDYIKSSTAGLFQIQAGVAFVL